MNIRVSLARLFARITITKGLRDNIHVHNLFEQHLA